MHADERHGLRIYRFDRLPSGRVDALISTRGGGASPPPYASLNLGLRVNDDPALVLENRRRLFDAFELPLNRSAWCSQPHEDRVAVVTEDELLGGDRGAYTEDSTFRGADALVTNVVGVPLCITVADCVPVVLYDPEHHAAGVVHAGWRGMVRRIVSRAVTEMRHAFDTDPSALLAAVGPSIGPDKYEVGTDVVDAARTAYGDAPILQDAGEGKAYFDLWEASLVDLEHAGVARERVEVARISTVGALNEFYSHRVEGETGRVIAVVALR